MLCLHGFPEGWMSWREVMRQLPGRRVCVPDLRGYGDTDRPRTGYDVWTLTDDVAGLIEALGLRRPVLVGHDCGGALGWIFAYRQMVRTLALPWRRARLDAIYDQPIGAPVTVVWGEQDGALSEPVARKSDRDAGCPVEWRPLPGVGHFVSLEQPRLLAAEIARVAPGRSARAKSRTRSRERAKAVAA